MVKTLSFQCRGQVQVRSPGREPGSHMPCSIIKKKVTRTINKMWYLHTYSGTLFLLKNEGNSDTYYNTNEA